jgi:hypothetical protein
MRHPDKIPRHGLLDIVLQIREMMYWDPDAADWDHDKEVNGGDLVDLVADLFETYNLVPAHSVAAGCKCVRCASGHTEVRDGPSA